MTKKRELVKRKREQTHKERIKIITIASNKRNVRSFKQSLINKVLKERFSYLEKTK